MSHTLGQPLHRVEAGNFPKRRTICTVLHGESEQIHHAISMVARGPTFWASSWLSVLLHNALAYLRRRCRQSGGFAVAPIPSKAIGCGLAVVPTPSVGLTRTTTIRFATENMQQCSVPNHNPRPWGQVCLASIWTITNSLDRARTFWNGESPRLSPKLPRWIAAPLRNRLFEKSIAGRKCVHFQDVGVREHILSETACRF